MYTVTLVTRNAFHWAAQSQKLFPLFGPYHVFGTGKARRFKFGVQMGHD